MMTAACHASEHASTQVHLGNYLIPNRELTPEAGGKAVGAFMRRIESTHTGFDTDPNRLYSYRYEPFTVIAT